MYLHGENAYIGNGRIVDVPNAEKYEEMTNIEARKEIEKIDLDELNQESIYEGYYV